MSIEEALLGLGLFRDTVQPPPDHKLLWYLGMTERECDHGVPTIHPCLACKKERLAA